MAFLKNGDSDLLEVITVTGQIEERLVICPHCKSLIKVTPDTQICSKCGGSLDESKRQGH